MRKIIFLFAILLFALPSIADNTDDREVTDESYKFTLLIPTDWPRTDMKETMDKDAISYTFESPDKKCAIMLLAFKLTTVKNLDDFVYTMEKDASLNIPKMSGEYTATDNFSFDSKSAVYKDTQYTEHIYFYRTKLPDAPANYVYMLRFITANSFLTPDMEAQIKRISNSFLPTAK